MDVSLRQVPETEAEALAALLDAHLLELGQYERSAGSGGYPYLPLYWRERSRTPLFIELAGSIVGFVLVREIRDGVREIAEFFVGRDHRRQGIGSAAFAAIVDSWPGQWRLSYLSQNALASRFWSECLQGLATGPVHVDEVPSEDGLRVWRHFTSSVGRSGPIRPG